MLIMAENSLNGFALVITNKNVILGNENIEAVSRRLQPKCKK